MLWFSSYSSMAQNVEEERWKMQPWTSGLIDATHDDDRLVVLKIPNADAMYDI